MKKRHKLHWTKNALNDLYSIATHISKDSKILAKKKSLEIKEFCLKLENHPNAGRIAPEFDELFIKTYRELIFPPWRILYKVSDTTIHILGIIDARRNMEDILLERILISQDLPK